MAGVNAARKLQEKSAVVLDRSQAYIGVLIDDLVTKENHEPYRMMTSRQNIVCSFARDNADLRLRGIGHEIGLVSDEQYEYVVWKKKPSGGDRPSGKGDDRSERESSEVP